MHAEVHLAVVLYMYAQQQTTATGGYVGPVPGAHWQSAGQNARWFKQNTRWIRGEAIFSGEKTYIVLKPLPGIREVDAGCEMGSLHMRGNSRRSGQDARCGLVGFEKAVSSMAEFTGPQAARRLVDTAHSSRCLSSAGGFADMTRDERGRKLLAPSWISARKPYCDCTRT
jgi:hypothetical protein